MRGEAAIAFACRLAVALWIAGYLAWSASDAQRPPPGEPAPAAARVKPRPTPASATRASAQNVEVGRADLREGAQLLEAGGSFPALSSSYEDFPSFRDYAQAMTELGARFVVVSRRKVVAAIDLASGAFGDVSLDAAFSPRARDYTGEPALAGVARRVREHFGDGAVVMMRVPRDLDAGLFGGIARVLSERGERHDAYREIRGRYEQAPGGGVRLRVDTGVLRDGAEVMLDLLFDLGEIARAGLARVGSRA